MKKLMSVKYSATALNTGMFLLRLIAGGLILIGHGYNKLVHFQEYKGKFMNFLGLGQTVSLSLVVFAEFFCAVLLILGLFTRFAVIPLIIVMLVALFKAHQADFLGEGEKATLFLGAFLAILFIGPGRASIDGMVNK